MTSEHSNEVIGIVFAVSSHIFKHTQYSYTNNRQQAENGDFVIEILRQSTVRIISQNV